MLTRRLYLPYPLEHGPRGLSSRSKSDWCNISPASRMWDPFVCVQPTPWVNTGLYAGGLNSPRRLTFLGIPKLLVNDIVDIDLDGTRRAG